MGSPPVPATRSARFLSEKSLDAQVVLSGLPEKHLSTSISVHKSREFVDFIIPTDYKDRPFILALIRVLIFRRPEN